MTGTDQNNSVQFSAGTIAQYTLKQMLNNMYPEAELDIQGAELSNHSGRVTLCTSLFNTTKRCLGDGIIEVMPLT